MFDCGKNKKKHLKHKKRQIHLKPELLFFTVSVIAALLVFINGRDSYLIDGNALERHEVGQGSRKYELMAHSGGADRRLEITVSSREYTAEEAEDVFERMMEILPGMMLGENISSEEVSGPLRFPKRIEGYGGVSVGWYPKNPGLIAFDGTVGSRTLSEPVETEITVVLKSGQNKAEYIVPVTVVPAIDEGVSAEDMLIKAIEYADGQQINDALLTLPAEVNNEQISYSTVPDNSWINILFAGAAGALLLHLKPARDRKNKAKQRENELLMDYSELISKLIVYMGAGLTAKNAFIHVAESYERSVRQGISPRRAAYEELSAAALELQKGVPERRAFIDFAHRCGIKCYIRLASILEHNLRTGDGRLEYALELEMQEAFELRKNTAKRLGEEAGTKLMAPLMISLITVMAIVTLPAMLKLM